jgi:type II secretory pathway component GspD/PulD (secretin)
MNPSEKTVRPDRARPSRAIRAAGGLLCALAFASLGCTESVMEYTKFGGWSGEGDRPVVMSGSPKSDATAYGASEAVLSDHDWQQLEKIAPKPIWERIARMRQLFEGKDDNSGKSSDEPPPVIVPKVTVTQLEGDRVRFFYRMRNYGGPDVISKRHGGTSRHQIQLTKGDLKPLIDLVSQELGDKGKVNALPKENTLVITCAKDRKDQILHLLAEADSLPTQVEINVRVFEVSHDFDFQYGAHAMIEHIAADNTQSLASTFSAKDFLDSLTEAGDFSYQGSALRLMKVFESSGITLDATFQALVDMGLVKVVSSPRMTVASGKTAYMLAGQELPIQSAKISNDKVISQKVEYKPIGVQLYITPQTAAGETVKMHVLTSVTAVSGFAPTARMSGQTDGETLTNPILDSREAETFVTVQDGQTLVMGGLRMIRTVTRERKIPGLGQIPGLEWLFKNHRSQNNISDLYFFVQPRILHYHAPVELEVAADEQ